MIVQWVKWHPRGHLILAGSEDFGVWMWNADKGVYLNMFSGHGDVVTCGDFTPDGNLIHPFKVFFLVYYFKIKSCVHTLLICALKAKQYARAQMMQH